MTDMANGLANADILNIPPGDPIQAQPDERVFKQSEVNEIVKRAKNDAVETYRRIQTEQPQYAQQKYGDAPSSHKAQFDEDHYRKIAGEEAKRLFEGVRQDALRQSQEDAAKRTVQNFYAKTSRGKEKYQDFDQVTGDVDLGRFPNVVQLVADFVDNPEDFFYELGKDRMRLVQLEILARESPNDAISYSKRFSQSIKENQNAVNIKHAKEPLSQMRPSNIGTDNGALSVSAYRKKYRI